MSSLLTTTLPQSIYFYWYLLSLVLPKATNFGCPGVWIVYMARLLAFAQQLIVCSCLLSSIKLIFWYQLPVSITKIYNVLYKFMMLFSYTKAWQERKLVRCFSDDFCLFHNILFSFSVFLNRKSKSQFNLYWHQERKPLSQIWVILCNE